MSAARPEHCAYCLQVLEAELKGDDVPAETPFDAAAQYPLFVTWNIWPGGDQRGSPRLRGCIGTFEAQPLGEGLAEYASIAAFKDRRFAPIALAEVPRLQCGVSLLTAFEECDDYLDWEIGTHGIYIHLPPDSSRSSRTLTATYLPDVMPAQNWTKQEAIDSAIRKAGFDGKITDNIRRALRVQRYRSEKVELSYTEYKAWQQSQ